MKFLGRVTTLDSFLKAYKASETKGFFLYERFDIPDKLDCTELPPFEAFFSKLRNHNPLEKDFNDYQKLVNGEFNQQSILKKLRSQSVPPTGFENYFYLKNIWYQRSMITSKDFLQWYNNKDVVSTLEAVQKTIEFYHDKGSDMLKLGCTLQNLANICLHKSTNPKLNPFFEGDKDLCEKFRENMTGGPLIDFTQKTVVDQTYIRSSSKVCKTIVGIDASQLYPISMCQEMPTRLYTR